MAPLVTVAVPVYKRLGYLPGALRSVAAQRYRPIELIVSDNGENGPELRDLVAAHYPGPFTLRRNPRSVDIVAHFNQLVAAAGGAYFVLLSDDDEIGPEFVAALVELLEAKPDATLGLGRVEAFSEDGARVLASTDDGPPPPPEMTGLELLRGWCGHRHKFISFTTNVARTADVRAAGGYPAIDRANGADNALIVKQTIGRTVVYSPRATFRHRMHETSFGKAAAVESLALSSRQLLRFLRDDPALARLRREQPLVYRELRELVTGMVYDTYLGRWRRLYRQRLSRAEWARAGFALPPRPDYTRQVIASLVYDLPLLADLTRRVRGRGARGPG